MKKRGIFTIFSLYLTAFLLFAGMPDVFAATCPDEWTCTINSSTKTVYLTKYNGTAETYQVPATMIVNDEEHAVVLGNSYSSTTRPFASTSVKHLSVAPGVQIKYPAYVFSNATNLETVDLRGADMSTATSVNYMFSGATNLKKVIMSGLDLSRVTSVNRWFEKASNIEEIDLSNTSMSKVTSFAYSNASANFAASPFYAMYNLKKINLQNFDTSSLTTAQRMFTVDANNSSNRNIVEEIDVTGWKIPNVTTLNEAFKHCGENNDIIIKGLETLDTSKVTNFGGTFQSTYNIKDLSGVENWDTSSATYFHSMFSEAKSITSLDLSNWNTENVTDVGSMFIACEKLTDINVSTWNTSKVKAMDEVFKGCVSLEVLDLSGWTSESVENKAGSHMNEMLGIGNSMNAGDYQRTPLKEITLHPDFKFSTFVSPGLRGGYWHLKEGSDEYTSKKYTPARLYTAYNNGTTPGDGYAFPHTYVLTELDPATAEYYAHGWGDNNVWEVHYPDDKFKGYCINLRRGSPSGYYDRTKILGNDIIDQGFLDSENYGWEPLGNDMREALITLIYYGYGNDADGIQEKYGLTDGEYLLITQQAIWDFTDRYSDMPERDATTKYGQAHYELVSKRFADIPNNDQLKLYLYESIDGKQNLLSISGLSDQAHAGVRVLKLVNEDDALVPLLGAEFSIYNQDNEIVATITSDENGYATKYNTDSIYGLPEGIYTIRETKAPRGYTGTSARYTFIVRPEDDNEIILVGKLSGNGEDTAMIFENTNNPSVQGGGVTITVTDRKTGKPLIGATFEVLDENGAVIGTFTSDTNGYAKSSKKFLELNKNYTVREVSPPAGYKLNTKTASVTVTENETYVDTFFDHELKKCNVQVQATKKFNRTLTDELFQFELIDNTGKTFATAKNQANGKVNFNLEYTGENLGFASYTLREVQGNDPNITYDTHTTELTVTISDEGEDELTCDVSYDYGNPTFTNTATADFIPAQDNLPPKTPGTGFRSLGLTTAQSISLRILCVIISLCSILAILMCKNRLRKL